MAATEIDTVERYWPTGVQKWLWVPTVSNIEAITRTEINAGTDLTREVAATDGWSTSGDEIETPDGDSAFVAKVPGKVTADDSSITLYGDPSGDDARNLFSRGTTGNIVRMPGGDIAGRLAYVFPVRVKTRSIEANVGEDDVVKILVQFSITREPAEDVTIPA